MAIQKTYEEINEKIRKGQAVVVTAEEIIEIVEEKGMNRQPAKWMWLLPVPLGPCVHLVLCSTWAIHFRA